MQAREACVGSPVQRGEEVVGQVQVQGGRVYVGGNGGQAHGPACHARPVVLVLVTVALRFCAHKVWQGAEEEESEEEEDVHSH